MGVAVTNRPGKAGAGKRAGFPEAYKDLVPGDRLNWLRGDTCKALIAAGVVRVGQVEAELRRLTKQRDDVERIVPTPARLDEHQRGYPFPPQADDPRSQMREARVVLIPIERPILWPAAYLSDRGATFDVVCQQTDARAARVGLSTTKGARRSDDDARDDPPSASVAIKEQMEVTGAILQELPMLTEEPAILKAQIARFLARKKGTRDEWEVREKTIGLSPPTCLS